MGVARNRNRCPTTGANPSTGMTQSLSAAGSVSACHTTSTGQGRTVSTAMSRLMLALQMSVQVGDAFGPERGEQPGPVVEVAQRCRVEPVDPVPPGPTFGDQPGGAEHREMAGDHRHRLAHGFGEGADGM